MGTRAENDLWGQVLAIENRYGDRGPAILTQKIRNLRAAGERTEADFWSEVAGCLDDLHAIRIGAPILEPKPIGASSTGQGSAAVFREDAAASGS
ncbi:hypothetical protein [uncultured Sphingopyxis sp.]|jgi:hypothetical protein|uniref:DUF6961 family protein n=1 Tax=uncultured Sphingopyxis sp. TaxID=310581 RepID=UPI0025EA7452|nr:hypothetical protein [uncultured Sphingopyxis sp.]